MSSSNRRDRSLSLDEAVHCVDLLDEYVYEENTMLADNMSNLPIHYIYDVDCNFEDKNAYVSTMSKILEELSLSEKLNQCQQEYDELAAIIYQWRPICRSLPSTVDMTREMDESLCKTIIEIYTPHIQQLYRYKKFTIMATELFVVEISTFLKRDKKVFVSSYFATTFIKYMAMLITLDYIKMSTTSIKNDFSAYKRAYQSMNIANSKVGSEESFIMSLYLAKNNNIREDLIKSLKDVEGHQDLFSTIIAICTNRLEKEEYLLISEKHMYMMVIGWCLYIIDSPTWNIYKLEYKKEYNLTKIDKLFKKTQVISIYVDIPLSTFDIIKETHNYDSLKWPNCNSSNTSAQSVILLEICNLRNIYCDYIERIAIFNNSIITSQKNFYFHKTESEKIYNFAINALKIMTKLKITYIEAYLWKMLNPTDHHQNENCPADAQHYERATRFNYTYQEKSTIVEIVAMIKGLQNTLSRIESIIMDGIKRHIYIISQLFLQRNLTDTIKRAVKSKKDVLKYFFISAHNACTDPKNNNDESGREDDFQSNLCDRDCTLSNTQLYILRTLMEVIVDDRNPKKNMRKYLDSASIGIIESFLKQSKHWGDLLNFSKLLRVCGDLSLPWYREFFLQATATKTKQFPIEMSIPWIMIDHVLESKDSSLLEYCLYSLEVYNDVANLALNQLRCSYLYDEIEAEFNICFTLFITKLSEQMFRYYKHWASSIILCKKFRSECAKRGTTIPFPRHSRFDKLLKLDNMCLLGRHVSLKYLISLQINAAFLKSLDTAISRYESSPLTRIIELENLIEANLLTHKIISKCVNLTSFENLLSEADQNVVLPYGRILSHTFMEISEDLIPKYCYNESTNRFVKGKIDFCKPTVREKCANVSNQYIWGTKALTISYNGIFGLFSEFVGVDVFQSIVVLLKYSGIAVLVEQLLCFCQDIIQLKLADILKDMSKVMPLTVKMPYDNYGSSGIFTHYLSRLKNFSRFPNMKTVVLQIFRELGNAIIVCSILEQCLSQIEISSLYQAGPFINNLPKCVIRAVHDIRQDGYYEKSNSRVKVKNLKNIVSTFNSMNIMNIIKNSQYEEYAKIADEIQTFMNVKLYCGLSLNIRFLLKLKGCVEESFVSGSGMYSTGILSAADCNQFHRYWSAIQFIFCMPPRDDETKIEELFGVGFQWAACTIIHLLDQQNRFNATDFSYHLLSIYSSDKEINANVNLGKMCARIKRFKKINDIIFNRLSTYKIQSYNEETDSKKFKVRTFPAKTWPLNIN
ncbi:Specifically Rac1-associated protein 1 [Intoshia linei]|uniref:Cytoplasmic FMR1-interacting protein n=1 Tax=Intoshia linei TaxID=1819745 RepID=A0A177BDE7_9BILA|nr:Specifically Rac1-associated protein 1 [Intoshia linei]